MNFKLFFSFLFFFYKLLFYNIYFSIMRNCNGTVFEGVVVRSQGPVDLRNDQVQSPNLKFF